MAVMGSRELEQWELAPLFTVGLLVTAIAVLAFFFPRAIALPVVVLAGWGGLTLIVESFGLWRERRRP